MPEMVEAWEPKGQQAASLQQPLALEEANRILAEVLQWHTTRRREAAEASAVADGGGLFDFDELPPEDEAPRAATRRDEGRRLNEAAVSSMEQLDVAMQDAARRAPTEQQALDGLVEDLRRLPRGDLSRRPMREDIKRRQAAQAVDLPSKLQAREWGKLLCVLQKEHPLAEAEMLARAANPQLPHPPPRGPVHIEEEEALEILQRRAEVNVRLGDLQREPLHCAMERGYPRLVAALLEARAEANSLDNAGETPLHAAAHSLGWCPSSQRERRLAITNLLRGRAEPNPRNLRGRAPLHIAVSAGDAEATRVLIAEKADINLGDHSGFTPLMWAAGRGQSAGVECLLDARADPRLQAHRGQTADRFAITSGHELVGDMLQQRLTLLDEALQNALAA